MMRTTHVIGKILAYLHRPFVQRLITLVISMLLAMSLIYMSLDITAHTSREEVAASPPSQPAEACLLEVSHTYGGKLIFTREAAQRTENPPVGRRQA